MTYLTNEQIRSDIADLTERIRQIRVEQGLPPDPLPRPKAVSIPLSLALIERLEPFKAIVIKLASILAQGRVTRIDTGKLAQYEEYARLLRYSRGDWCAIHAMGAQGAFSIIERMNHAIDSGDTEDFDVNDAMRRLHYCVGYMTENSALVNDEYDYFREAGVYPRAEKERLLSDPAAFQVAIDEVMAQIPNKQEDDLYE